MNRSWFGPEAWEPLAEAWKAFETGEEDAVLLVHTDAGETDAMPVSVFFRDEDDLRPVDRQALDRVRGRVLDAGAGVGSLSLLLQRRGVRVTALEVIPEGVEIMTRRGVEEVVGGRLEDLPEGVSFDTVLLLMNGTALAGTLEGFPGLLATLARHLSADGQVLVDSTDLGPDGELQYQMEFQGRKGVPFPQLFLGPQVLKEVAERSGWRMEVVWREEMEGEAGGSAGGDEDGVFEGGTYLACLTRR